MLPWGPAVGFKLTMSLKVALNFWSLFWKQMCALSFSSTETSTSRFEFLPVFYSEPWPCLRVTFDTRTMITPLSWTTPTKISFGLQTAQKNFEVATWDDPASQPILARTRDTLHFPITKRLDNKWYSWQFPKFFFSGSPKDAFSPRQQEVILRTPCPHSQVVGWWFLVTYWVMDICHCLGGFATECCWLRSGRKLNKGD